MDAADKKRLTAFLKARKTRGELDAFLSENKAAVFDILSALPGGNFSQAGAMIYRADTISYQYPASIIQLEQNLADQKKIAQLDGSAKRILKGCVKFEDLRK